MQVQINARNNWKIYENLFILLQVVILLQGYLLVCILMFFFSFFFYCKEISLAYFVFILAFDSPFQIKLQVLRVISNICAYLMISVFSIYWRQALALLQQTASSWYSYLLCYCCCCLRLSMLSNECTIRLQSIVQNCACMNKNDKNAAIELD